MIQEDRELLLKDLCARLPYGVKCLVSFKDGTKDIMTLKTGLPNSFGKWDLYNEKYSVCSDNFKPCLRPRSSMTEKEKKEFNKVVYDSMNIDNISASVHVADWLYSKHLDVHGLIPKGLAIEVKGNNPYKD